MNKIISDSDGKFKYNKKKPETFDAMAPISVRGEVSQKLEKGTNPAYYALKFIKVHPHLFRVYGIKTDNRDHLYIYQWENIYWRKLSKYEPTKSNCQQISLAVLRWLKSNPATFKHLPKFLQISNFVADLYADRWVALDPMEVFSKIPFQNGIVDLDRKELVDHSPEYLTTSYIPAQYDPRRSPTLDLLRYLLVMFGKDKVTLNNFRGLLRRAIVPCPDLQTGFYLYGRPRTGKSTIQNLIETLAGTGNVLVRSDSNFANTFEIAGLDSKKVIFLTEVKSFSPEVKSVIKAFTGRDKLAKRLMFDQASTTESFRSIGFLVCTSNYSLAQVSGFDPSLFDRLINIKLDIRVTKIEAGLPQMLFQEISGLLNWALTCPQEILHSQFRVEQELAATNYENTEIKDFIEECLLYEEGVYISSSDLYIYYKTWCINQGKEKNRILAQTTFKYQLLDTLRYVHMLTDVKEIKPRMIRDGLTVQRRCLSNLTLKSDSSKTGTQITPPAISKDRTRFLLEDVDPFHMPSLGPEQTYLDYYEPFEDSNKVPPSFKELTERIEIDYVASGESSLSDKGLKECKIGPQDTTKISTAISPSYVTAENFLIQSLRLGKIMNGPQISVGDAIKLYSEGCQLLVEKISPLEEIEEGSFILVSFFNKGAEASCDTSEADYDSPYADCDPPSDYDTDDMEDDYCDSTPDLDLNEDLKNGDERDKKR